MKAGKVIKIKKKSFNSFLMGRYFAMLQKVTDYNSSELDPKLISLHNRLTDVKMT